MSERLTFLTLGKFPEEHTGRSSGVDLSFEELAEKLKKAGWGKREGEPGRMQPIFKPDPFGGAKLIDEPLWLIDADQDLSDIQPLSKVDNGEK